VFTRWLCVLSQILHAVARETDRFEFKWSASERCAAPPQATTISPAF
jgi:hypothetical protein